ncbi:MAG: hypothetical protein FWD54_04010 [Endomicrobia bacterium]|nr:hypothetical protein [Endomicrobiia bacterium]MCL2799421.1 hypothetical protein [Endomicrobiia bacterium]
MLIWIVRILVILAGPLIAFFQVEQSLSSILIGLSISMAIVGVEYLFQKTPLDTLVIAIVGIVLGIIAANIIDFGAAMLRNQDIDKFFEKYSLLIKILFAYFGMVVAVKKKDEVDLLDKDIFKMSKIGKVREMLLLDTSAIIDGRIYDISETKFLFATFIIPKFVLNELQALADSNDAIKRTRSKRGLDIVAKLKKSENIMTKIYDKDYDSLKGVDAKLTELAKDLNAKIVTTDFNLNKMASIQGITVLNINDLANSLTPIFLPGESIMIFLVKEGSQQNQAVGYLEDGTMVVAEDGRKYLGKRVELNVTSIIQTSSGKMVFGRVEAPEQNQNKTNPRKSGRES